MYKYDKKLPYPVNIHKKDLKMAKYIITAYGGYAGELGAALRYFSQKFGMPTEEGKNLLNSIATEELGHNEMVCSMVHQLVKDASLEEMKEAGPFTVAYFASTGNPLADLVEDMAAEEKARVMYEHLIDLATDKNVIEPLLFLRQREVVHFARFKELYEKYKKMCF